MDENGPGWGLKHTAVAGCVMSIAQFIAFHQFVYPRSEGEKLEKVVTNLQSELIRVDTKHDSKSDRLYDKLEEVRREIATLVELSKNRR